MNSNKISKAVHANVKRAAAAATKQFSRHSESRKEMFITCTRIGKEADDDAFHICAQHVLLLLFFVTLCDEMTSTET